MWRDFKKGLQLMKYSYNFKINMVAVVFIILISMPWICFDVSGFIFGGTYFLIGVESVMQLNYALLYAKMIGSSSRKRLLEVDFPELYTAIGTIGGYLLLSGVAALLAGLYPENKPDYVSGLIILAILLIIEVFYYSVCYKIFIISTIIFAISFVIVYFAGGLIIRNMLEAALGNHLAIAFFIGLVIVILGCLVSNLLRRKFYQFAISDLSMGAALKKAMK